ncbi:MAG: orotate phosphoribosyltransferase [Planctomycetota bacterium]
MPMTDDQLAAAMADACVLRGTFTLRSGKTSSYYLDKYRFVTRPDLLAELAKRFADRLPDGVDRIAGPELGGVPIATAVSLHTGIPTILVRNAKKDYGTAKQFEGVLEPGQRVVITEDIATTGGQSIEAAKLLRDECGADVAGIIVCIDRLEGARANVEDAGFAFDSLFTRQDLGID